MDKASRKAAADWWRGKVGEKASKAGEKIGERRNAHDERRARVRADHGEPERVSGQRAERRARRTQTVQTSWTGRTTVRRSQQPRDIHARGSVPRRRGQWGR